MNQSFYHYLALLYYLNLFGRALNYLSFVKYFGMLVFLFFLDR